MRPVSYASHKGQAVVALLVFMVVCIAITSGAVAAAIVNSQSSDKSEEGSESLAIAESGTENAILRLLRDPHYTGETLTVGSGTAVTTVSGAGTLTVTSVGTSGDFTRKVQATIVYTNNVLAIQSWTEIP